MGNRTLPLPLPSRSPTAPGLQPRCERSPLLRHLTHRLCRAENGVTAMEYAIIASLLTVVIIVSVNLAGQQLTYTFETLANSISEVNAGMEGGSAGGGESAAGGSGDSGGSSGSGGSGGDSGSAGGSGDSCQDAHSNCGKGGDKGKGKS